MSEKPRLSLNTKTSPLGRPRYDSRGNWYPRVPNSFGLPAGETCPGKTDFCREFCYAIESEGRTAVFVAMQKNLDSLRNRTEDESYELLSEMMKEYRQVIEKYQVATEDDIFRIHWDGDFFSEDYARAWKRVIMDHPQTVFWLYTRSFTSELDVTPIFLVNKPENLVFYLSVDKGNVDEALKREQENGKILMAFCGATELEAELVARQAGKSTRAVKSCPENSGEMPIMSEGRGACVDCKLCIKSRPNILFFDRPGNGQMELFAQPVTLKRNRDPVYDRSLGGVALS